MTSKIKVDNINKVSDDSNIINKCGTTITLGASGDTIALASGASQTGFGRTGTVDWQTGSIKTATFTAANGEGYFANTSGGAFTMNLPAGTAGNIVSVVDYTNTFQTNALTIAPNGSEKIGGIAASQTLRTEGQSVTFVYVDATEGWKNVQDSTSNVTGNDNLRATGGTITECGDYKIHTFTGPGTFTVCAVGTASPASDKVDYMVVAGGGGAGYYYGGGGGGGGFRESKCSSVSGCWTASPLVSTCTVTVTATGYPIVVGAGGPSAPGAGPFQGGNGSNSSALGKISAGGGYGVGNNGSVSSGGPGGSGGAAGGTTSGGCGGTGNTPPVSPPQGQPGGGASAGGGGAGGGGAGGTGAGGPNAKTAGAGVSSSIKGTPTFYSGGGNGGPGAGCAPTADGRTEYGQVGAANTGAAAGGDVQSPGGSGIVVIRYKFQ